MQLPVDSMQSKCFLREHVNCPSNPPLNLQPILILIILVQSNLEAEKTLVQLGLPPSPAPKIVRNKTKTINSP